MPFDALAHPIIFSRPQRVSPSSVWGGHIPFAYLLVDLLRPRTFVELGQAQLVHADGKVRAGQRSLPHFVILGPNASKTAGIRYRNSPI